MGLSRKATTVIVCGALVLTLCMGIRQSFGLFLAPMTADLKIGREAFAFAMAVQNFVWGFSAPFLGMLADKYGTARVVVGSTLAYAAGLWLMAMAGGAGDLNLGAGVLVGLGISGTSFAVVLGAVARHVPPDKRSMALGVASAGGSFGQFAVAPLGQSLIEGQGWSGALLVMLALSLAMAPLAYALRGKPDHGPSATGIAAQTIGEAVQEAAAYASYRYLTLGFFVCGFQVVFVAVHLPAYLKDVGLGPEVGARALALIGFFNIIGTYACGHLGGRFPKRYLLSLLYATRSAVVLVFLLAPKTELSVLAFSSALGLLWLGTVPLTSGLIAVMFGPRYMATLYGIVFFSHQVGSFLGAWLGGWVYDRVGSYDAIWIGSIVLGLAAAAIHLPIVERPARAGAAA
jgi:predicted MFS family arabinose efflux permease